jgi:transposase
VARRTCAGHSTGCVVWSERSSRAIPSSGALFVFCNRRRTLLKALWWEGDGLAIYAKRLERGTFRVPREAADSAEIDRRSLTLLLEGVTPRRLHVRYQLGS